MAFIPSQHNYQTRRNRNVPRHAGHHKQLKRHCLCRHRSLKRHDEDSKAPSSPLKKSPASSHLGSFLFHFRTLKIPHGREILQSTLRPDNYAPCPSCFPPMSSYLASMLFFLGFLVAISFWLRDRPVATPVQWSGSGTTINILAF